MNCPYELPHGSNCICKCSKCNRFDYYLTDERHFYIIAMFETFFVIARSEATKQSIPEKIASPR